MGKGAVAIKCIYIYIHIYTHVYVYTYIHAYINKLFVSKTMERVPQSGDGSWSVGEVRNDILGLCCSFSCLNQGQCCSHFVSLPLFSSSSSPLLLLSSFTLPPLHPILPSYPPLLWMLLVLFAGCLTWLLVFVQCKLHAGSGLGVGGVMKRLWWCLKHCHSCSHCVYV